MSDEIQINQWLKDTYGQTLDGRNKFRVSWTTGQTEKRHGTFNDFYGDIFVRQFTGVREVPKYPFWKDRWVLEKLSYVGDNEEILEKSSYEPIFVFESKDGKMLPLNQRAIAFYMHFYLNRGKITPGMIEDEEKKKYEAEVNYFKDFIKDQLRSPYFGDLIY